MSSQPVSSAAAVSSPFDVVVVGNVGVDTNVYLVGRDIDFSVEANFTENIDYVGQAGGYAARGYAQLGWRTAFIGHVGDDHNGRLVRQAFAHDGIDATALFIDPAGTSRSVNFMYRDGRRKNFYDGRGHMDFEPDLTLCRQVLSGARLAHFNLPNWGRRLLPLARELGLTIACDLQDMVSVADPYRQDFINYADIIFFSAANQVDPGEIMAGLLAQRPDRVVIAGLGAEGAALGTAEGVRFYSPPAMDMPIIDTNGAGDGLAVGFLSSYVLVGFSAAEAMLRGQITARHTCGQKGSSDNLITAGQLDDCFSRLVENELR